MQSEVLDVIHNALINHSIDRIKRAVLENNDAALNWLREHLDNYYGTFEADDLIDEFLGQGLELVARERSNRLDV